MSVSHEERPKSVGLAHYDEWCCCLSSTTSAKWCECGHSYYFGAVRAGCWCKSKTRVKFWTLMPCLRKSRCCGSVTTHWLTRPEAGDCVRLRHRPPSWTLKIRHIAWVFCTSAWTSRGVCCMHRRCCCCCLAKDVRLSETCSLTAERFEWHRRCRKWAMHWCPCRRRQLEMTASVVGKL